MAGIEIVIANVERLPACFPQRLRLVRRAAAAGELKGGVLACPSCERRFYLPRAGRSMDEERLLLEPVPLLAQEGGVRVAISA